MQISESPKIKDVVFTSYANDNSIEILAEATGPLEYSLDGLTFQSNNTFTNLRGGSYTVIVRDMGGCGEDIKTISIVDYPRFFTPNNDGINDYWQVIGTQSFPNARIKIFNRYGHLLNEFSARDKGWDGHFNGKPMVANDYWFTIFIEGQEPFSGHFTLKL